MRHLLIAAVIASAMAGLVPQSRAQPMSSAATFGCDGKTGEVCWFTIHEPNGHMYSFQLAAHQRMNVEEANPGADFYLVSINALPPGDASQCGVRYWCKRSPVRVGYNN